MKLFKKGKHRGVYEPNIHWRHVKCYPNGVCHIATNWVKLTTPYIDGDGQRISTTLSHAQVFSFADMD